MRRGSEVAVLLVIAAGLAVFGARGAGARDAAPIRIGVNTAIQLQVGRDTVDAVWRQGDQRGDHQLCHSRAADRQDDCLVGSVCRALSAPADLYGRWCHDAVYLYADAIERAGSTGSEALVKALEATDFVGVRGRVKFDPTRDVMDGPGLVNPWFVQWQKTASAR